MWYDMIKKTDYFYCLPNIVQYLKEKDLLYTKHSIKSINVLLISQIQATLRGIWGDKILVENKWHTQIGLLRRVNEECTYYIVVGWIREKEQGIVPRVNLPVASNYNNPETWRELYQNLEWLAVNLAVILCLLLKGYNHCHPIALDRERVKGCVWQWLHF